MSERHQRGVVARLASVVAAVAGVSTVAAPWIAGSGAAQEPPDISMELTDQTFSTEGGSPISLSYDLRGRLPAGVLPTTTTTTSTTTTSTAPPATRAVPGGSQTTNGTSPGRTGAAPPARTTADRPATTAATTTTTVPPPPPVDGKVRVLVYPRITEQAEIDSWLEGDLPDGPSDGVELELTDALTIDRTGSRRSLSLDLDVPVADGVSGETDLDLPEPGLYPVKVQIRLDDQAVAEHVTIVRRVDAAQVKPLRLGVMAAAMTGDTGSLREMVDLGEVDVPLTVAIPPDLLASTQRTAPRLFDDLAAALRGDEAVTMPSDGLDASSAATADLGALFGEHIHDGETTIIELLPETPVRRAIWPLVDNDLSDGGAELVVGLGVRMFVATPAFARAAIEDEPPIGRQALVDLGASDVGALTIDPKVAELVEASPAGRSPLDQAIRLLSRLTIDPDVESSRGVVLSTATMSVPDPNVIEAVNELIDDTSHISFVPVSALPGLAPIEPASTVALPDRAGTDLRRRVSEVNRVRLELAHTASMLVDDHPGQTDWNDRLDALLTTDIDDAAAQDALTELRSESDVVRSAVEPPDAFTFTLTDRTSEILVPVTNASNTPLQVTIVPSSSKLSFPDGPATVRLEPNATTSVPVKVEARSNGTSSVAISITTPSDDPLVPPVFLTANVTSLTGLSQLLTGGAILVLATWWFSHLRNRRRARRMVVAQGRHPATMLIGGVSPDAAEAADTGTHIDSAPPPGDDDTDRGHRGTSDDH